MKQWWDVAPLAFSPRQRGRGTCCADQPKKQLVKKHCTHVSQEDLLEFSLLLARVKTEISFFFAHHYAYFNSWMILKTRTSRPAAVTKAAFRSLAAFVVAKAVLLHFCVCDFASFWRKRWTQLDPQLPSQMRNQSFATRGMMVVDLIRFQRVSGSSCPCSCFCFSHSSAVASEIEWIARVWTCFDPLLCLLASPCSLVPFILFRLVGKKQLLRLGYLSASDQFRVRTSSGVRTLRVTLTTPE